MDPDGCLKCTWSTGMTCADCDQARRRGQHETLTSEPGSGCWKRRKKALLPVSAQSAFTSQVAERSRADHGQFSPEEGSWDLYTSETMRDVRTVTSGCDNAVLW